VGPIDDDRSEDLGIGRPGLLRPKTEVEWRATIGEDFLSEDVKEQVVLGSFFERDFNLPRRRLLPRPAVLLQAGVGTPRS
jgi:hypothetical protein